MSPEVKNNAVKGSEIQLVIFMLAGERFALEISQVREIIRMQNITPMPKAPTFIQGVINLRGQIIPVMDLSERFSIRKTEQGEKSRIVVVDVEENAMGLVVDEVPEVVRILSTDIEPTPEMLESQIHAQFIRGVAKRDEDLIIIMDAQKILTKEESRQFSASAGE